MIVMHIQGNKTMKALKIFALFAALFMIAAPAFSQPATLFDGDIHSGGFGGPELKLTQLNDQVGLLVGGGGAWVVNNAFYLGGAGYGLVTDVNTLGLGPDTTRIDFGYGGGLIGYMFASDNLVHVGVQTLVGAGGVDYRSAHDRESLGSIDNSDGFFIVEPGVVGELNISKNIRLDISASYRFINGIETPGMTDKKLGGPSASMMIKFGSF